MMGLVRELFGIRSMQLDRLFQEYSNMATNSGQVVTSQTMLNCAPVWQAVQMISGDMSKTKRNIHRRLPNLGPSASEIDRQHPAQNIVSRFPNEAQSAKEFWTTYVFNLLIWHNSYAWIKRSPTNRRPLGLYQLRPDRTGFDAKEGVYLSEIGTGRDAETVRFQPGDILHCKGFQLPEGEPSLLKMARESIGVALAAQKHTAKFLSQDCIAGGVLEIPAAFTQKAKDVLEEGFSNKYKGQPFSTVVLKDGAKFHQVQIDAEKSQMNETRIWQAREVAGWFNIPASKLNIPDSGGYGSRTEDNANYFHQTIDPLEAEIEGQLDLKLLTAQQKKADSHYFTHEEFVKLDRKTKSEIGKTEFEMGASSPDEYRAWIGKNPRPDGKGGEFVQPNANHVPVESEDEEEPAEEPETDESLDDMKAQIVAEIQKQYRKKNETRFLKWLDSNDDVRAWLGRETMFLIKDNPHRTEEILSNV